MLQFSSMKHHCLVQGVKYKYNTEVIDIVFRTVGVMVTCLHLRWGILASFVLASTASVTQHPHHNAHHQNATSSLILPMTSPCSPPIRFVKLFQVKQNLLHFLMCFCNIRSFSLLILLLHNLNSGPEALWKLALVRSSGKYWYHFGCVYYTQIKLWFPPDLVYF